VRKISLDVTELQVESFDTVDEKSKERGTVHGHLSQFGCQPSQYTCPQTMCGEQCLSGWRPCQPTDAWTDGERMCYSGGSGGYAC
jgi:hypothetical protein